MRPLTTKSEVIQAEIAMELGANSYVSPRGPLSQLLLNLRLAAGD
jgi:hypothetical protein